jgi:hypothetical protein
MHGWKILNYVIYNLVFFRKTLFIVEFMILHSVVLL